MAVGVLTLKICSVESRPSPPTGSGVTDDVKRSLDNIMAAERGLARLTGCVDSWDDAEMLLAREALE